MSVAVGVVHCVHNHVASIFGYVGTSGSRRIDFFLHNIEKRWEIDQETALCCGILIAMLRDHYIVYSNLLYCSATAAKNEVSDGMGFLARQKPFNAGLIEWKYLESPQIWSVDQFK